MFLKPIDFKNKKENVLLFLSITLLFYIREVTRQLFLHENIYYGYTLQVPQPGASTEYLQHTFYVKKK